ncbi:MAG: AraC family transcriptional regulator [Marivirga sp.]|nr:AraC family transcriptional regulator [Marivirga sp.]
MLKILPQLFYQTPEIRKILVDGLSCIIHKKLDTPVLHKEGYVSTHAITLVLKGLLKIENDNNLLTTVQENQLVFLPKGLYTISDIIPQDGVFEAVVFFFEESLISEFLDSINLKTNKEKCVTHIIMDYTPEIKTFTESTLHVYGNKNLAHRSLTKIKLFELLHLLSNTQQSVCLPGALTTLNNKERKSLREFMHTNFSKPLAIEDYAYLTGRSISTFRRDFMEQFGISPKQWLIDKRLEKARLLLSNNHTTVSQVAMETGYENISHFVKAFHKKFGTPPKQFLMKKRKEVLV